MKILVWTPLYYPDIGGIELIAYKHVAGLRARKHELLVLTAYGSAQVPEFMDDDGVSVYRFPMLEVLRAKDLRAIYRMQKQIGKIKLEFRPDIMHINFGGPVPISFFHIKTHQIASCPYLVGLHSSVAGLDTESSTIFVETLGNARWVTANSQAVLTEVQEMLPMLRERSSVVYYGLPSPDASPGMIDGQQILLLGRLVNDKGFDVAIRAFTSVRNRFPQASLLVAGEGPEQPALKALVKQLGLSESVQFKGIVAPSMIPAIVNQSCMLLVPSRYPEAYGLVALEAAQLARPVIASRVGGLQEVVEHGRTGLLVEKEDINALAEAIVYLLENPKMARQLGKEGWRRADERFAWERYMGDYEQLYCRILENV